MLRQLAEMMAVCEGRRSVPLATGLKEICQSLQQNLNPARNFLQRCFANIPLCARSAAGAEIQTFLRSQFHYQRGKELKPVKVIEEPTPGVDPRLWHVKATWSFGDETFTERLLLEQAIGEIFVRIFAADGAPVVKVEPKPEPTPPPQKRTPSYQDPYGE